MKIVYFDCYAGASGDMILGALLDAGMSIEHLRREIAKLHLSHYTLEVEKVVKNGIGGSQAHVVIDQDHHDHHHPIVFLKLNIYFYILNIYLYKTLYIYIYNILF